MRGRRERCEPLVQEAVCVVLRVRVTAAARTRSCAAAAGGNVSSASSTTTPKHRSNAVPSTRLSTCAILSARWALPRHHTVRSFSSHGQQSAAQGSSTNVSRSDVRLIQYLDSSAHGLVRRWLLIGYFPIHLSPPTPPASQHETRAEEAGILAEPYSRESTCCLLDEPVGGAAGDQM
jgi:hypothetical protein